MFCQKNNYDETFLGLPSKSVTLNLKRKNSASWTLKTEVKLVSKTEARSEQVNVIKILLVSGYLKFLQSVVICELQHTNQSSDASC